MAWPPSRASLGGDAEEAKRSGKAVPELGGAGDAEGPREASGDRASGLAGGIEGWTAVEEATRRGGEDSLGGAALMPNGREGRKLFNSLLSLVTLPAFSRRPLQSCLPGQTGFGCLSGCVSVCHCCPACD